MGEISFDKFELVGRQVMIELPTEQRLGKDFSLIMVNNVGERPLTSGWFKVVKVGKYTDHSGEEPIKRKVDSVAEGQEAFIFFHNKPNEVDEVTLKSRQEQFEHLKSEEAKSKIIKPDNPFSLPDITRQFLIVPESSILLVRDYEEVSE